MITQVQKNIIGQLIKLEFQNILNLQAIIFYSKYFD